MREAVASIKGRTAYDGAGVKLQRIFGHADTGRFDPFLLLDAFGSDDPADYLPGFPMHPHRGIETVTYLLEGSVRHRDSLGSGGVIRPGDLQWMSAGSGIIHEEMPLGSPRGVHGLQLWVNLARGEKMNSPAYRGATASEVPVVKTPSGTVRVLAGTWGGVTGPITGVARSPVYLDVSLEANASIELEAASGRTAFLYVISGPLALGKGAGEAYDEATCVLLGNGDAVGITAGAEGARVVFLHAPPLGEPIAWGGPIVMNTREELNQAFRELDEGTFIKEKA
jgi:redox-sensitive bicupin YhaK (pirin superfamily)